MKDINLAYKVEDGMKIYISTKKEKEKENENEIFNDKTTDLSETTDNYKQIENKKNLKININTATQTQLETLPGIGPSTAIKILDYRKENGKFKSIEDIKEVSGIGVAKFEKIKDYIVT